jgi:glutamate N-acetyltransferase/amino-acid N-acetyltransferase
MADGKHVGALPLGFGWGAVKAGIKASGKLDVAVALAPRGANAAAMYTRNQVVAAPVTVGKRHLAATGGRVSAVLVNSGNANCATGENGVRACEDICTATAETFGLLFDEVIPSSTGIIGVPLPAEKILAALPKLPKAIGTSPEHAELFATAIMTTDTKMKVARAVVDVNETGAGNSGTVSIFGCAKGAGMIHPQLGPSALTVPKHATMLAYLFTDLEADSADLDAMLQTAAAGSFNAISIDGDTSTNDTLLLLASGASGVRLDDRVRPAFESALRLVCGSLAHQIVDDGEGVTHVVTLDVLGCPTKADALKIARSIAHSPLNKTAWSSADPNWGRIMAAAGYAGVPFDPALARLWIGDQVVFEFGMRAALFDEKVAHAVMSQREYTITLDIGQGTEGCTFLTCDLTEEYVRINADYST